MLKGFRDHLLDGAAGKGSVRAKILLLAQNTFKPRSNEPCEALIYTTLNRLSPINPYNLYMYIYMYT